METNEVDTIIDGHEIKVPARLMPVEPVKNGRTPLPTWLEAVEARESGNETPLDIFIHMQEPAGIEDENLFRNQLQAALDFVTADLVESLKNVTSSLESSNKGTDRPSSYVSDQVYKARAALKRAGAA